MFAAAVSEVVDLIIDQEVIAKAHPLRLRGLKAFCFAGAIRTLAQLLRRALTFVLDVSYTLGKAPVVQT
jgi:hypothetical protein